MFGLCALSKRLLVFLTLLIFPSLVWANSQQGTVLIQGAAVYADADFDAPIIAELKYGAIYTISVKKKGPFYRIRVQPGKMGWISDIDIQPGIQKVPSRKKEVDREANKEAPELAQDEAQSETFYATRYRGLTFDYINFTEDTMGQERSSLMPFLGFRFSGFNTVFSGDIYAEGNILFSPGAPKYYEEQTGGKASGGVVIGNFLLQTVIPKSPNLVYFYGFGPMVKYSHFNIDLEGTSLGKSYSVDDLNLGVLFNLGLGYRIKKAVIKGDIKYYWEKTKYFGAGLHFGWEF